MINTDVAIVGAGFSGTMVLINLIQLLEHSVHLTIIEKSGRFAEGVAYSTTEKCHILNVTAKDMGAFADNPNHFYEWLQNNKPLWEDKFPGVTIQPLTFAPRMLYALYLKRLFKEALREAEKKQITVECITGEVTSIDSSSTLEVDGKPLIHAKAIVLASNIPTSKSLISESNLANYVPNIWQAASETPLKKNIDKELTTVIIGTGLTMVDAFLSLKNHGYKGKIIAISKTGTLQESHGHLPIEIPPTPIDETTTPLTAANLLKILRHAVKQAKNEGRQWQGIWQAIRPHTIPTWMHLPLKEKSRVTRYLLSLWSKYRHRIPEEVNSQLQSAIQSGQLKIESGKVIGIKQTPTVLEVIIKDKKPLAADFVLNCSGAEINLKHTTSPLLQNLIKNKLIQVHPLNLGIQADSNTFKVKNSHNLPIYVIGQLLIGELLETVAVPELRKQSKTVADQLISIAKK